MATVEVDVDADVPISDDATECAPPEPGFPAADVFLEVRVSDELADANHALSSSILKLCSEEAPSTCSGEINCGVSGRSEWYSVPRENFQTWIGLTCFLCLPFVPRMGQS